MNTFQAWRRRGFTLVEILIVISIIGLLSLVVLASLSEARAKSRDNARVSDLKQIELALALYREANGTYPADQDELQSSLVPTFLPRLPADPRDGSTYDYEYNASNGFLLTTELETGTATGCYVKSRERAAPAGLIDCSNF